MTRRRDHGLTVCAGCRLARAPGWMCTARLGDDVLVCASCGNILRNLGFTVSEPGEPLPTRKAPS